MEMRRKGKRMGWDGMPAAMGLSCLVSKLS